MNKPLFIILVLVIIATFVFVKMYKANDQKQQEVLKSKPVQFCYSLKTCNTSGKSLPKGVCVPGGSCT